MPKTGRLRPAKLIVVTGQSNCRVTLEHNIGGVENTGIGVRALRYSTGHCNTTLGYQAGLTLETGSDNIYLNSHGGGPAESNTIRIGDVQTRAFIKGVVGVTPAGAAVAVFIDASGQLGTTSSSIRYKEGVHDLGDLSSRLLSLRPVAFRYKADTQEGDRPVQYGLIAEEVAETFPELVIYNEDGQPETVSYHFSSTLLLNELQRSRSRVVELESVRHEHDSRLRRFDEELQGKEKRLVALETQRRVERARLAVLEAAVQGLMEPMPILTKAVSRSD